MMGDLITVFVKSPGIPVQGVLGDYIDRCISILQKLIHVHCHVHVVLSLVDMPIPSFSMLHVKNGRAWYAKSREARHDDVQ